MSKTDEPGNTGNMMDVITGATPVAIRDPREAQRAIIQSVFEAETFEDILGAGKLDESEALLNVPLRIDGFDLNKSSFSEQEGGMPVYAVVKATRIDRNTGELVGAATFTCGASTVLAQLGRMLELDMIPTPADQPVMLTKKDKPTAAGFYPLSLVMA